MTPAEKIYSEERENHSVIVLRPEGMFYRAYERSAYLVCKSIREFKPTKRFYKNIGQEIVSIGCFAATSPSGGRDSRLPGFRFSSKNPPLPAGRCSGLSVSVADVCRAGKNVRIPRKPSLFTSLLGQTA